MWMAAWGSSSAKVGLHDNSSLANDEESPKISKAT